MVRGVFELGTGLSGWAWRACKPARDRLCRMFSVVSELKEVTRGDCRLLGYALSIELELIEIMNFRVDYGISPNGIVLYGNSPKSCSLCMDLVIPC